MIDNDKFEKIYLEKDIYMNIYLTHKEKDNYLVIEHKMFIN